MLLVLTLAISTNHFNKVGIFPNIFVNIAYEEEKEEEQISQIFHSCLIPYLLNNQNKTKNKQNNKLWENSDKETNKQNRNKAANLT